MNQIQKHAKLLLMIGIFVGSARPFSSHPCANLKSLEVAKKPYDQKWIEDQVERLDARLISAGKNNDLSLTKSLLQEGDGVNIRVGCDQPHYGLIRLMPVLTSKIMYGQNKDIVKAKKIFKKYVENENKKQI